jgi:hypothetical protein
MGSAAVPVDGAALRIGDAVGSSRAARWRELGSGGRSRVFGQELGLWPVLRLGESGIPISGGGSDWELGRAGSVGPSGLRAL